jgi:hypothetical protein
MQSAALQDRYYLALGRAARQVGASADIYRPAGAHCPTKGENRFLRMAAYFTSSTGSVESPNGYGNPLWHGIFDGSYTRVGDYVKADGHLYFIVSQRAFLPILCVEANRTISIVRPRPVTDLSIGQYGGITSGALVSVMREWPASVLSGHITGGQAAGLPTDRPIPSLTVYIPAVEGMNLSPGDLMTDDLQRTAVIIASERTSLGWRVTARLEST